MKKEATRQPAQILVVDDHREMRDLISDVLRKEGYRVVEAADGRNMHLALQRQGVDLVLLDLMLPGESGLEICRDLRAAGSAIPIIIVTARGDEIDRVLGLEMGADDYISKPFSGRELTARIKAVLRRTREPLPTRHLSPYRSFRFGKWTLDMGTREIEADGELVVPLSSGEYSLLLAFVQNPGRVLSRDQLLDLTKGRSTATLDRGIDLQVSRLRKKIEEDARHPDLIRTVWGNGYIFTARVIPQ